MNALVPKLGYVLSWRGRNVSGRAYNHLKLGDEPKISPGGAQMSTRYIPNSGACIDMQIETKDQNVVGRAYHCSKAASQPKISSSEAQVVAPSYLKSGICIDTQTEVEG